MKDEWEWTHSLTPFPIFEGISLFYKGKLLIHLLIDWFFLLLHQIELKQRLGLFSSLFFPFNVKLKSCLRAELRWINMTWATEPRFPFLFVITVNSCTITDDPSFTPCPEPEPAEKEREAKLNHLYRIVKKREFPDSTQARQTRFFLLNLIELWRTIY